MPESRKFCSQKCARKKGRDRQGHHFNCEICDKPSYKHKGNYEKNKNHFCSLKCANIYQKRNKLVFTCKTCKEEFKWSKSRISQANPTYCSTECRYKDKDFMQQCSLKGNLAQINKKGLNRLELAGGEILQKLGINHETQVPMFSKFVVDVLIEDKKLVIQWDGEYWHTKEKRKKLDMSQDAYLAKCGYRVLRITDIQIKNNIKEVYENIKTAIGITSN